VLAGGGGRRLGGAKAGAELAGRPLIGYPLAALEEAGMEAVVVACDMPFVSAELLAWLAATAEPLVVPSVGGRLQPLLARYDHSLEPALAEGLAGRAPLQSTVAGLDPRLIREEELARFGDPRRLCFNVNTHSDLETAERLLARFG
jgi:molybdopterin-guanine dinucleotide biosynthesis protein A